MITRDVSIWVESRLWVAHLIARWSCLRLLLLPNSPWQIIVVSLHLLRFSFIDDMQVLVVLGVNPEEVLVVADLLSHFNASLHLRVCLPYAFVLCCLQLLHVLFDDLTVPLRNLLAWGRRIAPCASRYFTRCEVVISSRAWSWVPTIGLLSLGYFPTLGCGIDLICDRGILLAFIRVDLRRRRIPSEDRSARLMTHTEWTLAIPCCRVLWQLLLDDTKSSLLVVSIGSWLPCLVIQLLPQNEWMSKEFEDVFAICWLDLEAAIKEVFKLFRYVLWIFRRLCCEGYCVQ